VLLEQRDLPLKINILLNGKESEKGIQQNA